MILGIDHINMVVNDLDISIDFYKKIFGFKEDGRKKLSGKWIEELTGIKNIKAEVVFLSHENFDTRLEILKYHSPDGVSFAENSLPNTKGIRHISFKTDDFTNLVKTLENNQVKFLGKPQEIPPPTEKFKSKICYFYDPDGVLLEITG